MFIFHRDVLDFHRAMNLTIGVRLIDGVSLPRVADSDLRQRLITEEITETIEKGFHAGGYWKKNPLAAWEQVIDGLCDSMYVTIGAAITFGIDLSEFVEFPNVFSFEQMDYPAPFERWYEMVRILIAGKRVACDTIDRAARGLEQTGSSYVWETAVALAGLAASIGHVAAFYGIPLHEFWKEVQRANMAKVGGPVRADGKRLKPSGWVGPNHLPLIRAYWPELG